MPEGPEVRIESNKLNKVLSGRVPDSIWFDLTNRTESSFEFKLNYIGFRLQFTMLKINLFG